MYIRRAQQKNNKTGEIYYSYRLVESYRNAKGQVRQRSLLNLGAQFSVEKENWKLVADRVEEILNGQQLLLDLDAEIENESQKIANVLLKKRSSEPNIHTSSNTEQARDIQAVDINTIEHQDIRFVGAEYVGLNAAAQLELSQLFKSLRFNKTQIDVALASIISRLAHPSSERQTHHYLTQQSALDELLETDFSTIGLNSLYRVSDLLLENKDAIESALYQREKMLFEFDEIVTLYDLTNTYMEGICTKSEKSQYGRSKEKRSDCRLVSMGLVLDGSGFPKASKIYPGNISEPNTLEEMLKSLVADSSAFIIMDAGIATEDNITWLQENNYRYIVVSRKRDLVFPEQAEQVMVKNSKHNKVKVAKIVPESNPKEVIIHCHSTAKEANAKAFIDKRKKNFEEDLAKLNAGLNKKGCTKKHDKVLEKMARLKEKYSTISHSYQIDIEVDNNSRIVKKITWHCHEEKLTVKQAGCYCLRSNETNLSAEEYWHIYTTLTEVEAAFRSLKSELNLRPIYHQLDKRIEGHIFITVLAYHLLQTIRYQLKQQGIVASWDCIRQVLATHCRITTSAKLEDNRVIKIRKSSNPNVEQQQIYKALNLSLIPGKTKKMIA